MTLLNQPIVRYCFTCKKWYFSEGMIPNACEVCGVTPTKAKCDRCNYEWSLRYNFYPKHCPSCKSPYYNQLRMQDRKNYAKLCYEKIPYHTQRKMRLLNEDKGNDKTD